MTRLGIALLLSVAVGLSSCASSTSLPAAARDALEGYWSSLPADQDVEHRITRAWPGNVDPNGPMAEAQVWCVEAAMSSTSDPSVDGSLVWIVVRPTPDATWSAALLATLSAIWPYEACGWDLPG